MPKAEAERNMRLFARTVMPRLQAMGIEQPAPAAAG